MKISLKDVEKYFEAFATTTVIRVFNFIRTSPFRLEQLFWVAVLIGFTAGTVWNVTDTFTKFYSEPTASQVNIAANDSSPGLVFPDAVICLQLEAESILEQYENKINESITIVRSTPDLLQMLASTVDQYHHRDKEMAVALNASIKNASTLKDQNALMAHYHQPSPDFFTEGEIALLGLTTLMYFRLMYAEMGRLVKPAWKADKLLPLYEAYVDRKIDFDALFALTLQASCVLLQFRVVRSTLSLQASSTTTIAFNVCDHWRVRFFDIFFGGQEMICYKVLGDNTFAFSTAFDHVTMTMRSEWLAKRFAPDVTMIKIDPFGAFAVNQQLQLWASFSAKQTITFAVDTVNTLLNLKRRPCAPKEVRKGSTKECSWWCSVESVVSKCACMPLWRQILPQFAELPTNLPSCALQFNESFLSGLPKCQTAPSGVPCSLLCVPNCETTILNNLAYVSDPRLDYLNSTPAIRLMATKFVYEEINEYITMDSKAFVAALGGNLSLYLGASFLALIHVVVFAVRIPFLRVYQTKVPPSGSKGAASPDEIKETEILLQQMKDVLSRLESIEKSSFNTCRDKASGNDQEENAAKKLGSAVKKSDLGKFDNSDMSKF